MRVHGLKFNILVADAGEDRDFLLHTDLAAEFMRAINDRAKELGLAVQVVPAHGEQLAAFHFDDVNTIRLEAPGYECPTCEPCKVGDVCPMPCTCHRYENAECANCAPTQMVPLVVQTTGPLQVTDEHGCMGACEIEPIEAIPVTRNEEDGIPF